MCEGEGGALAPWVWFVQMSGTFGSGAGVMEGVVGGRVRSSVQLGGMRFGFGLEAADAVFVVGRLRKRYFRGRPGGGRTLWMAFLDL